MRVARLFDGGGIRLDGRAGGGLWGAGGGSLCQGGQGEDRGRDKRDGKFAEHGGVFLLRCGRGPPESDWVDRLVTDLVAIMQGRG